MLARCSVGRGVSLYRSIAAWRELHEICSRRLGCRPTGYGFNLRNTRCIGQLSHIQMSSHQTYSPFSTSSKPGAVGSSRVPVDSTSATSECEYVDLSTERSLTGLPEEYVMELSGHGSVLVNNLEERHLDSALVLIRSAVERGDNIGIGELPNTRDNLQRFLGYTSAFTLTNSDGRMQALLLIEACFCGYFRSVRPHVATVHIITSNELSGDLSTLRDLARLATGLTTRLKRGYGACAIGVFYACATWYQALRLEGWGVTGCIQRAGVLTGWPEYTPSYVMTKDLPGGEIDAELNKVSMKDICQYADTLVDYSSYPKNTKTRQIESFPMDFVLNDGVSVKLRNARVEESEKFYQIFNKGGYGIDEFPTPAFFHEFIFRQSYNIVVEESGHNGVDGTQKGCWLSVIMISDSNYSRYNFYPEGDTPPLCDIYYAAVDKHSKGKGFGSQLVDLATRISKDLGYVGYCGDGSMENIATARLMLGLGFILCGVIPKSVRHSDKGWTDSVLVYMDLSLLKSFLPNTNSTKNNQR